MHTILEAGLRYYLEMMKRLKERLETFLGVKTAEGRLKEAIVLYNRMRELLKEISNLRKDKASAITGKDFFKLMHSTFYLDPKKMVEILECLLPQLGANKTKEGNGKPRILLTGNMLAVGDYKVIDLVEEAGGSVVTEQFCGGVRHYLNNIHLGGDLPRGHGKEVPSGKSALRLYETIEGTNRPRH